MQAWGTESFMERDFSDLTYEHITSQAILPLTLTFESLDPKMEENFQLAT